jgi:hypothetical protein
MIAIITYLLVIEEVMVPSPLAAGMTATLPPGNNTPKIGLRGFEPGLSPDIEARPGILPTRRAFHAFS